MGWKDGCRHGTGLETGGGVESDGMRCWGLERTKAQCDGKVGRGLGVAWCEGAQGWTAKERSKETTKTNYNKTSFFIS